MRDWPDGAQTLWSIQQGLLDLLRAIQADLAAEKAKLRSQRDYELIRELKFARFRARQVGDAFAWLLLGLDKHYILAMGRNSRVPVPVRNQGSMGVEAIAQALAAEGFGFPVLHDLTHCLRIGDITFVKPERDPVLVPVEVKTRFKGREPDADGRMRENYEVTVGSPIEFTRTGEVLSTPPDRGLTVFDIPVSGANRLRRQEVRLANAVMDSLTPTGRMVASPEGARLFVAVTEREPDDRWTLLTRLIRRAHTDGYAGEAVDGGAFYYAVYFKADGVDEETITNSQLPQALQESGFFLPPPANNSLVVMQVPQAEEDRHQRDYLPFYLWPLTKRAIFELHRGELLIVVLSNPAHFAKMLSHAGFDVEHKPGPPAWDSITVSTSAAVDPEGQTWHGQYPFVTTHITAAVNEFRSAQWVVDAVRTITQAFEGQVGDVMTERWERDQLTIDGRADGELAAELAAAESPGSGLGGTEDRPEAG